MNPPYFFARLFCAPLFFHKKPRERKVRSQGSWHIKKKNCGLFIFLPALDLNILLTHRAEGIDKGAGEPGVRDERDVMVDCRAANLITIGQLTLAVVFRNIDHQLEHVLAKHIHDVQFALFVRPADSRCLNAVIVEELRRSVRRIDMIPLRSS